MVHNMYLTAIVCFLSALSVKTEKCPILDSVTELLVTVGQTGVFSCDIPPGLTTIIWYKGVGLTKSDYIVSHSGNNVEYNNGQGRYKYSPGNSTLTLRAFTEQDEDCYRCHITQSAVFKSKQVTAAVPPSSVSFPTSSTQFTANTGKSAQCIVPTVKPGKGYIEFTILVGSSTIATSTDSQLTEGAQGVDAVKYTSSPVTLTRENNGQVIVCRVTWRSNTVVQSQDQNVNVQYSMLPMIIGVVIAVIVIMVIVGVIGLVLFRRKSKGPHKAAATLDRDIVEIGGAPSNPPNCSDNQDNNATAPGPVYAAVVKSGKKNNKKAKDQGVAALYADVDPKKKKDKQKGKTDEGKKKKTGQEQKPVQDGPLDANTAFDTSPEVGGGDSTYDNVNRQGAAAAQPEPVDDGRYVDSDGQTYVRVAFQPKPQVPTKPKPQVVEDKTVYAAIDFTKSGPPHEEE